MSGYSHNEGYVEGLAQQLRDGATVLDNAIGGLPEAVDAGASSTVVADAMRDLLMTGAGLATVLEQDSDKVNATSGAYGDVENNNAGAVQIERDKPMAQRVGGPL